MFGATLSEFRDGGRLWDNSFGSSWMRTEANGSATDPDILQESVFPRQPGGPASMGSRGRIGMGLNSAGVLPRGHGGYWAS